MRLIGRRRKRYAHTLTFRPQYLGEQDKDKRAHCPVHWDGNAIFRIISQITFLKLFEDKVGKFIVAIVSEPRH